MFSSFSHAKMLSTIFSGLSLLAVLLTAQEPFLDARTCFLEPQDFFDGPINASDSALVQPAFSPPASSHLDIAYDWTWHLAVESIQLSNGTGIDSYASTSIWLETNPSQNLDAANNTFLGCAVILAGLNTGSQEAGQHDDGSCSTVISQECRDAVKQSIQVKYPLEIPMERGDPWNMCSALQSPE